MKRRSKIWLIFLIVGVVCTIITRCRSAKAEGYDPWSGDPWQPPEWLTSEDPFLSPAPLETPSPTAAPSDGQKGASGEGGRSESLPGTDTTRGVPNDGQYGTVDWKAGTYFRPNGLSGTISWQSPWSGTTAIGNNSIHPWISIGTNFNGTQATNKVFENTLNLSGTNTTYSSQSCRYNGICLSLRYTPASSEIWNNEMQFIHTFNWQITYNWTWPTTPPYQTADLNLVDVDIPVTVFYQIVPSDGTSFWFQNNVFLSNLTSYSYTFDLDQLPDDQTIKWINIHVVINFDYTQNILYKAIFSWASENPSLANPYDANIYPTITYSPSSLARTQLKIRYTENAKNRSWLLRLLQSLFLPDPDAMADLFNSYLGDPSVGGSSVVIGMREILYNHLLDNQSTQDAVLTLPAINIPMGDRTIHIFDGYSFNLTEFYNGTQGSSSPFRALTSGVQFIVSALIFSAFFQSLWSMVSKIFGLHLWQGVNGEDLSESDEGDD